MGFMDAYKSLEKLCGEIYEQQNGVGAYIDEMTQTPGSYYVRGWDDDLKNLKHYRWVRNQISHEPNCSEANMCEPFDTVWLERFYDRIMTQSDPLALYQQSLAPQKIPPRTPTVTNPPPAERAPSPLMPKKRSKRAACLLFLVLAILLIFAAFILYKAHLS